MSFLDRKVCANELTLPCQLFVPAELKRDTLLVVVHGIDTRAEQLLSLLVTKAARRGIAVMAPDFSGAAFRGYQTLAGAGEAMRSADALGLALDAIQAQLGLTGPVDLMGFSGGAQFAHRYALFHPEKVRRLIAVSAGWYTYLNEQAAYPHGLGRSSRCAMREIDSAGFLAIPKLIAVGAEDTARDANLRQTVRADRRGDNRLERARKWHRHLAKRSAGPVWFAELPGTSHSVTQAMRTGGLRNRIFDFIASDRPKFRTLEIES